MPIGDEFVKLFLDATQRSYIDTHALEDFARKLNVMNSSRAVVAGLTTLTGELNPNALASGRFTTLPHQAAGMARDSNFNVNDATYTVLTYETAANLGVSVERQNFKDGIDADVTTGEFGIAGQAGNLWLIGGYVGWETNGTGLREIRVRSGSGGSPIVSAIPAVTGASTTNAFCIMKRMISADETHFLHIWQNSGGALQVVQASFFVARIR